jgi:hypothetical protein
MRDALALIRLPDTALSSQAARIQAVADLLSAFG